MNFENRDRPASTWDYSGVMLVFGPPCQQIPLRAAPLCVGQHRPILGGTVVLFWAASSSYFWAASSFYFGRHRRPILGGTVSSYFWAAPSSHFWAAPSSSYFGEAPSYFFAALRMRLRGWRRVRLPIVAERARRLP